MPILALALAAAHSQEVTLPHTEVRAFHSEIVDQNFKLMIGKPMGPPPPGGNGYPVIYVLDADIGFPVVRNTTLSLLGGGAFPSTLVVGIAYAGGFMEGMQKRNRDYTPTPDPVFMKFMGGGGESGGADAFLRFLREELKPFIEENYPADPEDNTLVGFSFGGLFAVYTLLKHPGTFQRYVAGSPSLWWGNEVIAVYEQEYADAHTDLAARVFIGAGGHETQEHDEAFMARMPEYQVKPMRQYMEAAGRAPLMVEVVEPFVKTLRGRGYSSLELHYHLFPEETHDSVAPMVISRGLRTVFAPPH